MSTRSRALIGLFARAAAREIGRPLSPDESDALQRRHGELYRELLPERRPLPGAVELLAELRAEGIVHSYGEDELTRRRVPRLPRRVRAARCARRIGVLS